MSLALGSINRNIFGSFWSFPCFELLSVLQFYNGKKFNLLKAHWLPLAVRELNVELIETAAESLLVKAPHNVQVRKLILKQFQWSFHISDTWSTSIPKCHLTNWPLNPTQVTQNYLDNEVSLNTPKLLFKIYNMKRKMFLFYQSCPT